LKTEETEQVGVGKETGVIQKNQKSQCNETDKGVGTQKRTLKEGKHNREGGRKKLQVGVQPKGLKIGPKGSKEKKGQTQRRERWGGQKKWKKST